MVICLITFVLAAIAAEGAIAFPPYRLHGDYKFGGLYGVW
jgi:hypothetical protein